MVFQRGVSGNPKGRPPGVFSTFADTAERLMEKYTHSEIKAIAADDAKLDDLPTFHAMVIIQLANALKAGTDIDYSIERERLLDRITGKAVSRTELTGKNGKDLQINVVTGVQPVIIEGSATDVSDAITHDDSLSLTINPSLITAINDATS